MLESHLAQAMESLGEIGGLQEGLAPEDRTALRLNQIVQEVVASFGIEIVRSATAGAGGCFAPRATCDRDGEFSGLAKCACGHGFARARRLGASVV